MRHFTIGHRLPHFLAVPLFGDRANFGLVVQAEDPCWQEWLNVSLECYDSTQKQSFIGNSVNNAGYRIMEQLSLDGQRVLEVGPGDLNHISNWQGVPEHFVIVDVRQTMCDRAAKKLAEAGVSYTTEIISHEDQGDLPFEANEFDVIITFYSLEHLCPLQSYLDNMLRVLKPKGKLIGAIPCEGGLAWGIGRCLTSRRWFLKNTSINPDKIICWEHPNFAEQILMALDQQMDRKRLSFWPFGIPAVDLNLVAKFIYEKR